MKVAHVAMRVGCRGTWLALVMVLCACAGCGGSQQAKLLATARSSVETGLNAWKLGDKPDSLRTSATPIDFHDDAWQQGAKLVDFKLDRTFIDTDGAARCAVELTIQPPDGAVQTVTVTYQVVSKPHPVVARDPFN